MAKQYDDPESHIVPLNMNGLNGRMLRLPGPARKKTEILFVYGQHSSLERWYGLMKYVSRYGTVTAPDLPGFGGMESFYKLGKKPTIDNFADYLASFMKLTYKNKKVVIVGLSYGFVVATRMLQRYPELRSNVRMLVSLVGFTHYSDFSIPRWLFWSFRTVTAICAFKAPAVFFRYVCLNGVVIRSVYRYTLGGRSKYAAVSTPEEAAQFVKVETWLWQHNDVRTHAVSTTSMLTLDNCTVRVGVPVWHVTVDNDQYLDHERTEQHMNVIFSEVHIIKSKMPNHAPSVIADEKSAAPLVPQKLRQILVNL